MINDELNPKLQEIFVSWFEEFSSEGKMFPNDCCKFLHSCTGDLCDSEDKRIKELFYQWDEDSKGYLSANDFLQFYKDACEKKPRVVWTNLQNKNFRNDLTNISDQQIGLIQEKQLVRYYLMNNKQFFDIMLDLEGDYQLQLLNKIPTSIYIYDWILNNLQDFNINDYQGIKQLYYLNTMVKIIQRNDVNINNTQLIQLYQKKHQSKQFLDILIIISIINIMKCQFKQDSVLNIISNQKFNMESLEIKLNSNQLDLLELIDQNRIIVDNIDITNYDLFILVQQLIIVYNTRKQFTFDQNYLDLLFINDKIIRTAVHKVIYVVINKNRLLQQTIIELYINRPDYKFCKQFYQLIFTVIQLNSENLDQVQQIAFQKLQQGIQSQQNIKILTQILKQKKTINIDFISLFKIFFQNYDVKNTDKQNLFELSQLILQNSGEQTLQFIQNMVLPMLINIKINEEYGLIQDQNNFRSLSNYVGIKNPGCICYMNAMLQQFFMIPTFRKAILLSDDKKEKQMIEYNKQKYVDDNLLHQIQTIFAFLQESIKEDFDSYGFCFAFKDYDGNPTNIKIQQDAQEFLNLLFDRLENQLKNTPFSKLIENVFGGQTCTTFTCLCCKNKIQRFEAFNNLQLEVKNLKNLQESFNQFILEEFIQDYFCNQCQEKQDVCKTVSISNCPNYLIIHLKRMVFNFETMENEKINTQFDFTNKIDISQYCEQKEQEQNYELMGIVVHIGVAQFGHYISYIKSQEGNWFEFNDSNVTDFDPNNIQKQCFGGNKSMNFNDFDFNNKSAYMLIYEKKLKSQFKLKFEDDQYKKYFNNIEKIENFDYQVDFDNFPQFIPQDLQNQIQISNQQFILQKNVYNLQFYEFLEQILQSAQDFAQNDEQIISILDTYLIFILKIMARSKQTQKLEQITQKAIKYLSMNTQFVNKITINILNNEQIYDLLIKSTDRIVRLSVKNLILESVILFFKDKQIDKQDFMENQLNDLIQIFQICKNCLKLQQYFELLLELININQILQFMKQKCLLSKLITFLMDLHNYQNIEPCLDLIARLIQLTNIKFIEISKIQDFYEKIFSSYKKEYIKEYLSPITYTLCYNNYKNSVFISSILLQSLFELSQDKIQILFHLIKQFFNIKDQYQQQRIQIVMGAPNFKNLNNKQNNQLIYEYPSPLIIQKSQSFIDTLLSQKNKYNIIKYFVFVFKLALKNNMFNTYINEMPSPNIMFKSFLEWVTALLNIIQKESGKIWQFEYEEELNLSLQLIEKIKQQTQQEYLFPQYNIIQQTSQQQSFEQFYEIKVKYQDLITKYKIDTKIENDEQLLQDSNSLRLIYVTNESNYYVIVKAQLQTNQQLIPKIEEIVLILQPNQTQKIVTLQKIDLNLQFQTKLNILSVKINQNLNDVLSIYNNFDQIYENQK